VGRHEARVTKRKPALIAVDGVTAPAIAAGARAVLPSTGRTQRSGISQWDASGVFEELAIADDAAGHPSARTLLLLYAADLAFRLRWEIRPSLEDGNSVIAAPYIDTAVAFGRAAGLSAGWLSDLFGFAPPPTERRFVELAGKTSVRGAAGFVEFGCHHMAGIPNGLTRPQLVAHTTRHLRAAAKRRRARTKKTSR
jgi:hypothetical protein